MRQLHLHVPDDVAETLKARARAVGKSLSSYVADLIVKDVADEWPAGFFEEVVGGWKGDPLEVGPTRPSRIEDTQSSSEDT